VRWLYGARRTGGPGGAGETLEVEGDEERFAFDAGEDEICGVRSARGSAGVHTGLGNVTQQTLLQSVAKGGDALGIFGERFAGDFGGFAESHYAGDVFGAGTEAALVMPAVQELAQTRAAAHVQGTDALRGIQLVTGDGEEIESHSVDINGNFAGGLNRVGVEVDVGLFGDPADFRERLDGAKLIVGVHDGDENCFRVDSAAQVVQVN